MILETPANSQSLEEQFGLIKKVGEINIKTKNEIYSID